MDDRLEELLQRLVSSGHKCSAVSASEIHEVVDGAYELEQTIKNQSTEIEQLKAQNMAVSEVVDAAIDIKEQRKRYEPNSVIFNNFDQALATYKQTMEGCSNE